ncbi:MAG: hypothetical protein ACK541_04930 [Burkholderiales bacterium]
MLVVRVMGSEPIDSLSLQISRLGKTEPQMPVNGIINPRSAGRWIDFLFPISMPPGRYLISHENPNLAPFQMNFEIGKNTLAYVGRLVVFQDRSRPSVLEDQYFEDLSMFHERITSLHSVKVTAQLGSLSPGAPQEPPPVSATNQSLVEVVPVSEAFLEQLPWQAREPFKRYLKLDSPRAFAVNEEGEFGLATGKNVVQRALQDCSNQTSKRPCRIFSVDQSVALTRPTSAPMTPASLPSPGSRLAPPLSAQAPFASSLPIAPPPSSGRQNPTRSIASPSMNKTEPPPSTITSPASTVACQPPPSNPNFKGWLRLSDIIPDGTSSKGPYCAK